MNINPYQSALRQIVLADGIVCSISGLMLILASSVLARPLGLPEELLRGAGLILLPYGLFVSFVARRHPLVRMAVWAIVMINVLWVIESFMLLLGGSLAPTMLGTGFVIVQALVGGLFAILEVVWLRRFSAPLA